MDALATVTYPGNKKNLVEAEMVADNLRIDGMKVSFSLIFPVKPTPSSSPPSRRQRQPSTTTYRRTWR